LPNRYAFVRLVHLLQFFHLVKLSIKTEDMGLQVGDVAAVVRPSTISPLNNRTNKRNKKRGVKTIDLLHIAVQ